MAAVAQSSGKDTEVIRNGVGIDEASDVAVWLTCQLRGANRTNSEQVQEFTGIDLVRFARARDKVTLRMARDPAFTAQCRRLVAELSMPSVEAVK